MRKYERTRKALSILLCVLMLVQYVPTTAFAVGSDNLCEHHAAHTAECGYAEAVAGSDCTHVHSESCYALLSCVHEQEEHECTVKSGCIIMEPDCHHTHGDCGYAEAVAPQECTTCQSVLTHAENCGYVAPVAEVTCACVPGEDGTVTHTEGCGYVAGVEEVKCACQPTVIHGGEGCTYVEGKDGSPCTHVCSVEAGCYKLLCTHSNGGHDDACGYVRTVEEQPCQFTCRICAVQSLIDALPTAEDYLAMVDEDQIAVQDELLIVYEAYTALSAEEQAEVDTAALYSLRDAVMNGDEVLVENPEAMWGDSADSLTGSGTLDEAIDASPAYIQLQTNITRTSSVTFNHTGDMTLDLNGTTLSGQPGTLLILSGGNLSIVDPKGGGMIDASGNGNAVGVNGENSVFKVEGGTIVARNFAVLASNGTAYLNGGTLQSTDNTAVRATHGDVVIVGTNFISNVAAISCYEYSDYDYSFDLSNATGESYTFSGNAYEASKIARITLPEGWAFFDSNGAIVDIDNTTLAVGAVLTAKSKYVSAPALNIADGSIVLNESEGDKYYQQGSNAATAYTGQITITGTSDANSITVQSGTHDVVLSDLNISAAAPFDISAGATVNLYLSGENVLTATAAENAGLHVPSGATLNIYEKALAAV